MLYEFSLPTKSDKVPTGPEWLHEIKYDGYRMMLIRERDRVRLISRGGHDWADRFPLIVSAAPKLTSSMARSSYYARMAFLRGQFRQLAQALHDVLHAWHRIRLRGLAGAGTPNALQQFLDTAALRAASHK
jgi:ATP-dependent DNA ligase